MTDEETIGAFIVSDRASQAAEFRKRKRRFASDSFAADAIDVALQAGWVVDRQGKRKTRMRREKDSSQWLEDRVWCLLYKMGYANLNNDVVSIDFVREDGTSGTKKICAVAFDDETAFVIECFANDTRGRRSLKNELGDSEALKDYVRKLIFKLFASGPKPRLIWAYATENVIWSEADVRQASQASISITTENELQYFEAFIKHMGPAGRFQVLGEFLKGQKVPGLGNIRVPAIKGKVGGQTFYSFVATPRRLLKVAFINHQALNHPDGRPAYQRMISSVRIKEIGKYITEGGFFPTNIIVNFLEKPRFDFLAIIYLRNARLHDTQRETGRRRDRGYSRDDRGGCDRTVSVRP